GAGKAGGIAPGGARAGRPPGVIPREAAPPRRRFGVVDGAAAGDGLAAGVDRADDVVAEAETAARAALAHPSLEPAPGLLREVLEEEGVHRALEPDMELADLALGGGDDLDAVEAELLVEAGDVLLVA